jgi:hypothetical protein
MQRVERERREEETARETIKLKEDWDRELAIQQQVESDSIWAEAEQERLNRETSQHWESAEQMPSRGGQEPASGQGWEGGDISQREGAGELPEGNEKGTGCRDSQRGEHQLGQQEREIS